MKIRDKRLPRKPITTARRDMRRHVGLSPSRKQDDTSKWSIFDPWINRAAQISAIVTPIIAVIVLRFTGIPIYQNVMLNEEVARKQITLQEQSVRLDKLNGEVVHATSEIKKLSAAAAQLERQKLIAQADATRAADAAEDHYKSMRASIVTLAIAQQQFCSAGVNAWTQFYSPIRVWSVDEPAPKVGDRYANLESIKTCQLAFFQDTRGLELVRSTDLAPFIDYLRARQRTLAPLIDSLDASLAKRLDARLQRENGGKRLIPNVDSKLSNGSMQDAQPPKYARYGDFSVEDFNAASDATRQTLEFYSTTTNELFKLADAKGMVHHPSMSSPAK